MVMQRYKKNSFSPTVSPYKIRCMDEFFINLDYLFSPGKNIRILR